MICLASTEAWSYCVNQKFPTPLIYFQFQPTELHFPLLFLTWQTHTLLFQLRSILLCPYCNRYTRCKATDPKCLFKHVLYHWVTALKKICQHGPNLSKANDSYKYRKCLTTLFNSFLSKKAFRGSCKNRGVKRLLVKNR